MATLWKFQVVFVSTLYLVSALAEVHPLCLIGEVEQNTDALGGDGMAAKQAHRIMPECGHRHWRRAGVMALQLVECGDERP